MRAVRIFELVPRRVLVARRTAHEIEAAIEGALDESQATIELDFDGIDAVTPSFVDETLGVIQSLLERRNVDLDRIRVTNPPTRLSSKFEAIGRGRNLHIVEDTDGTWVITPV